MAQKVGLTGSHKNASKTTHRERELDDSSGRSPSQNIDRIPTNSPNGFVNGKVSDESAEEEIEIDSLRSEDLVPQLFHDSTKRIRQGVFGFFESINIIPQASNLPRGNQVLQDSNILRDNQIRSGRDTYIGNLPSSLRRKNISALQHVNPVDQRANILLTRSQGSVVDACCSWIEQDNKYRTWLESDHQQMLWLKGDAGMGKTFLSIYLTKQLETRVKNQESGKVIYYFFNTDTESDSSAAVALRSLIWMMCDGRPELEDAVDLQDQSDNGVGLTFESLWTVFAKIIRKSADSGLGNTYCLLIGLDKCHPTSRQKLMEKIGAIHAAGATDNRFLPRFKLLIISQPPISDICPTIHDEQVVDLKDELHHPVMRDNLNHFIDCNLQNMMTKGMWDEDFRSEVRKKIENSVGDNFSCVSVVLREITRVAYDPEETRAIFTDLEKLESNSRDLTQIYSMMLKRRPKDRNRPDNKTLRTVLCAMRPLTLLELGFLALVKEEDQGRPREVSPLVKRMKRIITDYGGSLVLVVDPSGSSPTSNKMAASYGSGGNQSLNAINPESTARLMNPNTLKPFLEQHFKDEIQKTHKDICLLCFRYLLDWSCHGNATNELSELDRSSNIKARDVLLDYAIRFWPMHYQLAKECQPDIWKELGNGDSEMEGFQTKRFWTDSSPERDIWLQSFWRLSMPWWDPPIEFRPLHFAAYFGLNHLTRTLLTDNKLQRKRAANEKTARTGMTPLHWAARNGHFEVVQELLKVDGIELDGTGYRITPLLWAVQNGHVDVVELLLKGRVDKEACVFGKTPLLWAVSDGNSDLVRLLLKYNAKTDARVERPDERIANHIKAAARQAASTWIGHTLRQKFNEMQADQETNAELEIVEARERAAQSLILKITLITTTICLPLLSILAPDASIMVPLRSIFRALGWEFKQFIWTLTFYGFHWISLPLIYRRGHRAFAAIGSIILCSSWAGLLSGQAIMFLSATVCCKPTDMLARTVSDVPRSLGLITKLMLLLVAIPLGANSWLVGIEASISSLAVALTVAALFAFVWAVFSGFVGFLLAIVLVSHADIGVKEWSSLAVYFLAFAVASYVSLVAHLLAYREGTPEWQKRARCYILLIASPLTSMGIVWLKPLPTLAVRGVVHLAVVVLAGIWASAGVIVSIMIVEVIFAAPELARLWRGSTGRGHTALHIAVEHGYVDIVKLLLPKADIDALTSDGKKAEDLTRNKEIKDILEGHRRIMQNSVR